MKREKCCYFTKLAHTIIKWLHFQEWALSGNQITNAGEAAGEGSGLQCWWEGKVAQALRKPEWKGLRKQKVDIPRGSAPSRCLSKRVKAVT